MKTTNLILILSLISITLSSAANFITNGNFETNTQGWSPFNNNGTQTFALDAISPIVGTNSAKITITNGTSNGAISENWRLGARWGISTFKSGRYLVHFKAKASRNLTLVSMFQQNFSPYSSWGYVEWNLTSTTQDFDVVLENINGGVGGYWAFVLYYGHLSTGDQIWIDDVKIEELVGATSGLLTDGNICNGNFESNIANYNGTIQGWQKSQTSPANFTYSTDTSVPISGTASFKATSAAPGTAGWHSMLSWNFYPMYGAKYTLQFKAKATLAFTMSAEIWDMWNSGSRYNNLGFTNFNITTSVQTFTVDFPTATNVYYPYNLNFWLGLLPAGQSVWIDDVKVFQTSAPILNPTTTLTSITNVGAVSGGNVLSTDREITSRGVCWSTSQNPTISNTKTTDGSGNGIFTSSITGLTPNTTYYVRSYATNSIGTSYGTQLSFSTLNEFTVAGSTSISAYTTLNSSSIITIPYGTNLTVNNTATVRSITVAPGGKLSIDTGNTLNATNGITLQSNENGTATLLNSGTLTGTVTAQQYLGTARNWYVSSPVSNATSPSTNITRYYEYVEAGTNDPTGQPPGSTVYWKGLNTGTTMEVGKGYIAQASAGTTVQFSGTPNNGDIEASFNLTRDDAKGKGFNLVGNPYPSYIDWTKVAAANPNLDNTYYYRTKNIDDTYAFVTWNGSGNTFVNSKGGTANTTITRFIPPTQAFWIRVKSGTLTTKMNFNNGMREHRDDNGNLMKSKQLEQRTMLRLQLTNGIESDETLIYTDANAVNEYDSFDSPKMMNNSAVSPDLYTKTNSERLVINGLNSISDNMELSLGFSLNAASILKLKATEMINFPTGTRIYLRDKQQNSEMELTPETEYTFSTTEASTNNESRFSLLFRAPGTTTGVNTAEKDNFTVFVNAQNEIVILAKESSNYAIYNAVGQLIENGVINSKLIIRNSKLNAGVYVVKVNNVTERVIIK